MHTAARGAAAGTAPQPGGPGPALPARAAGGCRGARGAGGAHSCRSGRAAGQGTRARCASRGAVPGGALGHGGSPQPGARLPAQRHFPRAAGAGARPSPHVRPRRDPPNTRQGVRAAAAAGNAGAVPTPPQRAPPGLGLHPAARTAQAQRGRAGTHPALLRQHARGAQCEGHSRQEASAPPRPTVQRGQEGRRPRPAHPAVPRGLGGAGRGCPHHSHTGPVPAQCVGALGRQHAGPRRHPPPHRDAGPGRRLGGRSRGARPVGHCVRRRPAPPHHRPRRRRHRTREAACPATRPRPAGARAPRCQHTQRHTRARLPRAARAAARRDARLATSTPRPPRSPAPAHIASARAPSSPSCFTTAGSGACAPPAAGAGRRPHAPGHRSRSRPRRGPRPGPGAAPSGQVAVGAVPGPAGGSPRCQRARPHCGALSEPRHAAPRAGTAAPAAPRREAWLRAACPVAAVRHCAARLRTAGGAVQPAFRAAETPPAAARPGRHATQAALTSDCMVEQCCHVQGVLSLS